jgi:hypothetical protein
MPDLIRHPVLSMDVACASEDTGACALQGTRASKGMRVFAGMTEIQLFYCRNNNNPFRAI